MTAPLAASLSIPSSLDRDRLTMTRPDEQEVRLREARRPRARCPECGKLGVLEVLTVHRPGLPSVRQTVIRCTRTARKDPRGRELAAGRCPLAIVSEEPLPDQEGEFLQFLQDHEKGPDQDPPPAVDCRRMPQDSASGDLCGMPVEAARPAQEALEDPPPPATSSDPEPAPLDRPGAQDDSHQEPEEEPMPEEPRTCCRCNAPIDGRGGRRYCPTCAKEAQREGRRARHLRTQARKRPLTPAPVPVGRLAEESSTSHQDPAPAPRPVEVLRQLLALDPEARAAVLVLARTEAA